MVRMNSLASQGSQSWLSWFLRGVLLIIFLVLLTKMFEVQIIKGEYYRNLSEQNRIRHIPIPAPRGRILSSNGEALADNIKIKKSDLKESWCTIFSITLNYKVFVDEGVAVDQMSGVDGVKNGVGTNNN